MTWKCLKCGYESNEPIEFIRSEHKKQRLLCNECSEKEDVLTAL